ncbi:MAG: hypothetical protein V4804_10055 [Pseudomonadota bacterium]
MGYGKTTWRGLSAVALLTTGFGVASEIGAFSVITPAYAQDGHDDGGHEDGGEDGGHEGGGGQGGGGQGNGGHGGGHGEDPVLDPSAATGSDDAPQPAPTFMARLMKDAYVRAEMGMGVTGSQDASWLPPDYNGTTVPKVLFDLGHDSSAFGALAVGRDFQNGYRAELAFNVFGKSDFAGDWSSTEPATPGPHASVKGDTRSFALMLNGYYSPFEGTQRSGRIKPFVTAGLGLAHNTMGDWTRINVELPRTERSFEGSSQTALAWTVGLGMSIDLKENKAGNIPKLEISYRYFDLGNVRGGTTPLPGSGAGGDPVKALNFDKTEQVISIGIRIPL